MKGTESKIILKKIPTFINDIYWFQDGDSSDDDGSDHGSPHTSPPHRGHNQHHRRKQDKKKRRWIQQERLREE